MHNYSWNMCIDQFVILTVSYYNAQYSESLCMPECIIKRHNPNKVFQNKVVRNCCLCRRGYKLIQKMIQGIFS